MVTCLWGSVPKVAEFHKHAPAYALLADALSDTVPHAGAAPACTVMTKLCMHLM